MKRSTLLILATLAGIIVIAAVMTSQQRGSFQVSAPAQGEFYPELDSKIAGIDKFKLVSPSRTLEFARRDDMWVASSKYDYPANATLIQKTLKNLATMQKTQEKTKKPEGYEQLGVEDNLSSTSRGFRIEAFTGSEPVVNVHLGAQASTGKSEFYVRDHGDAQVWQVRGDLNLKDDDETWLSSEIIDIDKNRIESIDFKDKDGNAFTIKRASPQETSFDLTPVPTGRKVKSPYIIDMASKGLMKMTLSDVKPLSDFDMDQTAFATYRTFDGLVVQLFYAEKAKSGNKAIGLEKKGWIKLITSLDEAQIEKGKGDKEKLTQEVERLNNRHQNWAYHIPSYKIEQIKRSLESLLEPLEKKPVKKN